MEGPSCSLDWQHDLHQPISQLLNVVDEFPDQASNVANEMHNFVCNNAGVSVLMELIRERSSSSKTLSPFTASLLAILSQTSVKLHSGLMFAFSMAFEDWAMRTFTYQPGLKLAKELTDNLWFLNELRRNGLVSFQILKVHTGTCFLTKPCPSLLLYMARMLQEADNAELMLGECGDEPFYAAACSFVAIACRQVTHFDEAASILSQVEAIEDKHGWIRNGGTSLESIEEVATAGRQNEPGHFNLDENVDIAVENLTQYLQSQHPVVFTERVGLILDSLFSQINGERTQEAATKLCVGISKVSNSCGKTFVVELMEHSWTWFSETYRNSVGAMLSNCPIDVEAENLELSNLSSYLKKTAECPKLISKLFLLSELPASSVISFLEMLVESRNEEMYLVLLKILSEVGNDLEAQAAVGILGNIFDCLERIQDDDEKLAPTIGRILSLRQKKWGVLSSTAKARPLKSESGQQESPLSQASTSEMPLCDNLFSKFESVNLPGPIGIADDQHPLISCRKRPANTVFWDSQPEVPKKCLVM